MDGEIISFDASFRELFDIDETIEEPGYWRHKYWETAKALDKWAETNMRSASPIQVILAVRAYQIAKRALVERGMTMDEVEAMSVSQAILLAEVRVFKEMQDEFLSCYFLPYWQAKPLLDRADDNLRSVARECKEPLPIASTLLPATGAARTAFARLEQRIAILRVIEALRLYGAASGGQLPKRLEDVSEVPIPVDPSPANRFHTNSAATRP